MRESMSQLISVSRMKWNQEMKEIQDLKITMKTWVVKMGKIDRINSELPLMYKNVAKLDD
jgi:hypothetical protein